VFYIYIPHGVIAGGISIDFLILCLEDFKSSVLSCICQGRSMSLGSLELEILVEIKITFLQSLYRYGCFVLDLN
jgi:hypothetical protein